jgi:hypothetical protein
MVPEDSKTVKKGNQMKLEIRPTVKELNKYFSKETKRSVSHYEPNTVTVRDSNGKCFQVSKNDPLYRSGKLVHNMKDVIACVDTVGNHVKVWKHDKRVKNGELIPCKSLNIKYVAGASKIPSFEQFWNRNFNGRKLSPTQRDDLMNVSKVYWNFLATNILKKK